MMEKLIYTGESGGGYNENTFYLIFDEEKAEFYVLHKWDYYRPGGVDNNGEKQMSIKEFKSQEPRFYQMLTEKLKSDLFSKK